MVEEVTKDMTLGEVINRYPKVAEVMLKYGLHCIGCHVGTFETIEQGALAHGMSEEQLTEMVDEINAEINKKVGKK